MIEGYGSEILKDRDNWEKLCREAVETGQQLLKDRDALQKKLDESEKQYKQDLYKLEKEKIDLTKKLDDMRGLAVRLLKVIKIAPSRLGEKDLVAEAEKILGE